MKLYEIPAEIEKFEDKLIENEGELTPELEAEWKAFVQSGKDKLEGAAFVLQRLKSDAATCRTEVQRLQARAQRTEKNRGRLCDLTLYALKAMGGKIKTALVSMYVGRTGKLISVELKEGTDLEAVAKTHPQFVRVKYEADLEPIKEAYKQLADKVDAERERLTNEARREGSMITEADIEPQIMAFWKDLVSAANLPECFTVRNQQPTESLQIR
jgi:iron uptake system EfeUOB component EfeO/EfeM